MSIRHVSYIYERRFLSLMVLTLRGSYPQQQQQQQRRDGGSSGAVAAAAAAVVSTAIVPTSAVILAKSEASRDSP